MATATSSGSTPTGGVPSSSRRGPGTRSHLGPVLDGLADVLEDFADALLHAFPAGLVALAVDRQEHPRLGELTDGALRGPPRDAAVEDLLEGPDGVAADDGCGWTMRWMSMPAVTSAPVTESTRNGMSSVTTWITVRALDQPSNSVLGL